MILVNIGCGEVFHPAWINLDVVPSSPEVHRCEAGGPLPFAPASVDAVYHAHMLEHLSRADAVAFLAECRRVLRPNGTLRCVVPDLEGIAVSYLRELNVVRSGGDATLYDWSRLELIDQVARTTSGGAMAPFLRRLNAEQVAAVRTRAGSEVGSILDLGRTRRRHITAAKILQKARHTAARLGLRLFFGRRMQGMYEEGAFRHSGEVHRVMYDSFSLARLLCETGFSNPTRVTATVSRIPEFAQYELDAIEGATRKPDSLFMEAVRP